VRREIEAASMQALIDAFLLAFAALFPIINPVGCAPIFLELTKACTEKQRNALCRGVAINSFFLLAGSFFIGSYALSFFGISLPIVRVGGGLIVTVFGWKLLNAETPAEHASKAAASPSSGFAAASTLAPDAFYPLTMPLTVGPGTISVAITLGSQQPDLTAFQKLLFQDGGSVLGILAVALTILLCYRFATPILRFLGPHGEMVVMRMSAFILVCIGIQIMWNGWRGLNGLH
jgi:multiple antibiotic resistance protein